ncbi:unnamed protein product [Calicophoron daubneyi]|uniref:3CxxC-type domain-containing protein n=1 Tax=Calicophoron daubneyi TaxID=300641 RepID=A0AAV2TTJ0_CALDB
MDSTVRMSKSLENRPPRLLPPSTMVTVDYYEMLKISHWDPKFQELANQLAVRLVKVGFSRTGLMADYWPLARLERLQPDTPSTRNGSNRDTVGKTASESLANSFLGRIGITLGANVKACETYTNQNAENRAPPTLNRTVLVPTEPEICVKEPAISSSATTYNLYPQIGYPFPSFLGQTQLYLPAMGFEVPSSCGLLKTTSNSNGFINFCCEKFLLKDLRATQLLKSSTLHNIILQQNLPQLNFTMNLPFIQPPAQQLSIVNAIQNPYCRIFDTNTFVPLLENRDLPSDYLTQLLVGYLHPRAPLLCENQINISPSFCPWQNSGFTELERFSATGDGNLTSPFTQLPIINRRIISSSDPLIHLPVAVSQPNFEKRLCIPQHLLLSSIHSGVPVNSKQGLNRLDVLLVRDEAKTRFMCPTCGKQWTSMKGSISFVVVISYHVTGPLQIDHRIIQPGANVFFELFAQSCGECEIMCQPKWYPEEVYKVIKNLFVKIHEEFYSTAIPWEDQWDCRRRDGQPSGPHDFRKCVACRNGMCCGTYRSPNSQASNNCEKPCSPFTLAEQARRERSGLHGVQIDARSTLADSPTGPPSCKRRSVVGEIKDGKISTPKT